MYNDKCKMGSVNSEKEESGVRPEEDFSVSGERYETLLVICYTLYVKNQPKSIKPFKPFKPLKSLKSLKSLKTSIQLTADSSQLTGNSSIRK